MISDLSFYVMLTATVTISLCLAWHFGFKSWVNPAQYFQGHFINHTTDKTKKHAQFCFYFYGDSLDKAVFSSNMTQGQFNKIISLAGHSLEYSQTLESLNQHEKMLSDIKRAQANNEKITIPTQSI